MSKYAFGLFKVKREPPRKVNGIRLTEGENMKILKAAVRGLPVARLLGSDRLEEAGRML